MCECKERGMVPDEFMTEYCIECGRIWVIDFGCGERKTERFHPISRPLGVYG